MSPADRPAGDEGLLEMRPRTKARRLSRARKWLLTGRRAEPEPSQLGPLETPKASKVGICCSGGGIRSAAFNLGALQALQSRGILREANYLAAVSGGSYIAASWCMVAKTGPDDSDEDSIDETPPFAPGSAEEQYLRNRCSYLAPDGLSKLFMAYRVLLGLVFNLFFVGLVLFALGVVLAGAVYGQFYGGLDEPTNGDYTADVPGLVWIALAVLGVLIALNGIAVLLARPRRDFVRYGVETWAVRLIVATAALAVFFVAIPVLVEAILDAAGDPNDPAAEAATGSSLPEVGAASFATVLTAVLLQLRAAAAEPATVLKSVQGARGFFMRLGARARLALVYLAGAIAGPLLLLLMLVAAAAVALKSWDGSAPSEPVLGIAAGAVVLFLFLYAVADLNTWSLHPFYRRRLASAFALKRIKAEDGRAVAVERPYDKLVKLSESGLPEDRKGRWPMLIVCAAANVSDPGATPPGRGVTSFTFSPNAIGGPLVGAKSTLEYEHALGTNRDRDITLPAAVAMSGAALSPSMGKMTRKPFMFLMALANVRLGVWVPNPQRIAGWRQHGPGGSDDRLDVVKMPRPKFLVRELLGRNRLDSRFLYVSDGGHYENLGLVELLRRGCGRIYCFDASGGESFTNLGDAVALARSELQINIDIDPRKLVATGERKLAEKDCASGTIHFSQKLAGKLVYARTVMTEDIPWDVHAYHDDDPTFPHHSTADQLYTDQKFEAYRALGWCAGMRAADEMADEPSPPLPAPPGNGGAVDRTVASWHMGEFSLEVHQHPGGN